MTHIDSSRWFGMIAWAAAICTAAHASAGDVVLGRPAPPERRIAVEAIDHAPWSELLKKYVDGRGLVDYRRWKDNSADIQLLDRYLERLSQADVTARSPKKATLAFWINAYNAVTIRGILREYPTSSIRNHTARVFGYNIWQDLKLPVGDALYSLEQIEHEKLRKLGEPRIHFAIVCASIGCPPLRSEAYVADRLDEQLADNARKFFANPRNLQVDAARATISVSSIMSWYGEDFGPTQQAQLKKIAPYVENRQIRSVMESGKASVRFLDYDWSLNEQSSR